MLQAQQIQAVALPAAVGPVLRSQVAAAKVAVVVGTSNTLSQPRPQPIPMRLVGVVQQVLLVQTVVRVVRVRRVRSSLKNITGLG